MPTWFYFIVGFFLLITIGTWLSRIRVQRIAALRIGKGFENFCEYFSNRDVPIEVLSIVYKQFQELQSDVVPNFPVQATDNIGSIYGIVNEDFNDIVIEILNKCGRTLPSVEVLEKMRPVVTVEDLVLSVIDCPTITSPKA